MNAPREDTKWLASEITSPNAHSSITHDPIPGRSLDARFTWWLFRFLKPIFMPKPVYLKGPQVFPHPPPIPSTLSADRWEYEGWNMTVIRPKNKHISRSIIYYHGGAFNYPMNQGHWRICSIFAEELDAEVIAIPTPLAPENTSEEVNHFYTSQSPQSLLLLTQSGFGFRSFRNSFVSTLSS